MEFGPSETQRLFERLVRTYLGDRLPMDALHRLAKSGSGFDEQLWGGLVELGLAGVLVPERFGGAGLGVFEAALAAEALGYFATPGPFAAACVMAPLAILGSDSDAARAAWLPPIAPSLDRMRPVGKVELFDVPAELLPAGDARGRALRVLDAGRTMLAADTLGAAQSMLDRAVAYAKQREQFGRLIGSFQAVKHMCADMVTMLEPCRALVWYAAHAQDAIPEEARLAACHAKAHLGEVGREVSRMATEAHGGMGFTDELGLHYWFKRVSANRHLLGGPERCRQEAAALQGWG